MTGMSERAGVLGEDIILATDLYKNTVVLLFLVLDEKLFRTFPKAQNGGKKE